MRKRAEPTSFAEADDNEEEQFDDDSGEDWKPEKVVRIELYREWHNIESVVFNVTVEGSQGHCETEILRTTCRCCQETEEGRVRRGRCKQNT